MNRLRSFGIGCTFLALAFAMSCAKGASPAARAWWSHVEYLASDRLEGRDTGSEGYRQAAAYVGDQFRSFGVLPGAGDGFLQPIEFVSRRLREAESSLELIRSSGMEPVALGEEATISMSLDPAPDLEASLVFTGYGLSLPEAGYDDLAGLDLRGKVAVYVSGGPASLPGPLRAHAQASEERWKAMQAAGAAGLISISNPNHTDVPWARAIRNRLNPRLTMADEALRKRPGLRFNASFNPAHAERLFQGSGYTFAGLLERADREVQLPRFELPVSIRAHIAFDAKPLESSNVVGIIPGSDPDLKNEFVVLSAHLDHLGVGGAIDGDSIYNGAMDNASGIATLIEIARTAHERHATPRRSLVLLAVTGEEKGLLGSRYFAVHPTVATGQIVADVNMDMFLPLVPFKILTVYGLKESDLGDMIVPVAKRHGARVQDDPEPQRRIFVRSDQYNFIRASVPALSFKIGYEKDSPEAAIFRAWTRERYHAPSDDLKQPVDLEAAFAFTEMLYDFSMEVANRPQRPHWKQESFFTRFAAAAGDRP